MQERICCASNLILELCTSRQDAYLFVYLFIGLFD